MEDLTSNEPSLPASPYVVVLGVAQDGGYPQTGCALECCERAWRDESRKAWRMATALGLVDPQSGQRWLFEVTPDVKPQVRMLQQAWPKRTAIDGAFITHAHMGHYTGLLQFGKEAWNTQRLPLYLMPKMNAFLSDNQPWSALLTNENVDVRSMCDGEAIRLNERLSVVPFLVTHRGEYSETVGFEIISENPSTTKRLVFIPDIDSWKDFEERLIAYVETSDYVFIDGTFYEDNELKCRDMSAIPHPRISESIRLFKQRLKREQDFTKVHFIHLNHTNPCLDPSSEESRIVNLCQEGGLYCL